MRTKQTPIEYARSLYTRFQAGRLSAYEAAKRARAAGVELLLASLVNGAQ